MIWNFKIVYTDKMKILDIFYIYLCHVYIVNKFTKETNFFH